jgi:hypothetical protein
MKAVGAILLASAIAVSLSASGAAQTKGAKKAGRGSHSMTGCLQKGDEPNTYKLTNVEGTGPKTVEIVAASGVDLAPHVGHKVTITGATMRAKAAAKAEGTKDMKEERGEHHMRATAVQMVSNTCR